MFMVKAFRSIRTDSASTKHLKILSKSVWERVNNSICLGTFQCIQGRIYRPQRGGDIQVCCLQHPSVHVSYQVFNTLWLLVILITFQLQLTPSHFCCIISLKVDLSLLNPSQLPRDIRNRAVSVVLCGWCAWKTMAELVCDWWVWASPHVAQLQHRG